MSKYCDKTSTADMYAGGYSNMLCKANQIHTTLALSGSFREFKHV